MAASRDTPLPALPVTPAWSMRSHHAEVMRDSAAPAPLVSAACVRELRWLHQRCLEECARVWHAAYRVKFSIGSERLTHEAKDGHRDAHWHYHDADWHHRSTGDRYRELLRRFFPDVRVDVDVDYEHYCSYDGGGTVPKGYVVSLEWTRR